MRDRVSQSAQSDGWKFQPEIRTGEDAALQSGILAAAPEMLPDARGVEEERQNIDSFLLHRLELVGIEAESFDAA